MEFLQLYLLMNIIGISTGSINRFRLSHAMFSNNRNITTAAAANQIISSVSISNNSPAGTAAGNFIYFAYGSNLYSKRIRINNPSAVAKGVGLLKGYKLEFTLPSVRWKGSAANIIKDDNSHVYGVLWELSEVDSNSLDKQEGVHTGIYERLEATVEILTDDDPAAADKCPSSSPITCLTYQLTAATRQKHVGTHGDAQKPSPIYKSVMIRGAQENKLPAEYLEFLSSFPDNGYQGPVDVNIDN